LALILTVDPSAIAANWRTLNQHHAAPTGAVLKADAYGTGAEMVARTLHGIGVRDFFTATPNEAARVRAHIPNGNITVLDGFWPSQAEFYLTHNLIPSLNSTEEIKTYLELAATTGQRLPAMIQIDTGMARLGLDTAGLKTLIADPLPFQQLNILYLISHLASAEEPQNPKNAAQAAAFKRATAALPPTKTSFANSSGIFLGPDFRSNLARPGAALYGVNPTPHLDNPMRCVLRLDAQVLQIREIAAGESVGYNSTFTASRPTRVATLACGYADGYLRSLSAKGLGFFENKYLPLIGRVSMDLLTFDATDSPGLKPGHMIELIGPHLPPDRLAALAGTNTYEILTSLSGRADRVFGAL